MKFPHLNKIIFNQETKLKEILESFNKTAPFTESIGFGIITDSNGKCIGVITDGDIRRQLLKNTTLQTPVKKIMNKKFCYVNKEDSNHKILLQFEKKIINLPVLNKKNIPIDLYQYSKFMASSHSEGRIIRARAPVRVSYSGGGTDMSSYINELSSVVLTSTINKYCTASIIIRNDKEIHITSKDLGIKYIAKSYNQMKFGDGLDLIKAAIKIMQPKFGFDLETYAEFDPGTGLGGSSAVVVSILGALNYFRNDQILDSYQIADLAYQVERIDMDISGGWQDQYACTFGSFNFIEFNKDEILVNPLKLNREIKLELEYNLMLFRLGNSRNSGKIQKKLIKSINLQRDMKYLHKIQILAKKMKNNLLRGNVKGFADLLNESWLLKQKMNKGVSNKYVADCYNTCIKHGALGGKLLGAGASGYLLIYSSPLYQKKIKNALNRKGAKYEPFKFSDTGLEVWSTRK